MTFDAPDNADSPAGQDIPEDTPTPGRSEPAAPEAEVIGTRRGMFGVSGTGDTSGYGGLVTPVALPAGTPPPYGGWFDAFVGTLRAALTNRVVAFDTVIEKIVVFRDEITLHVRREHLVTVASALRDDSSLRFELCLGVNGVHYPDDEGRELHAAYHLMSITHNRRIRLEVSAPDANPHIPSLFSVYPTIDWHERETYDFFGILFDGHPSLTRITMPDDWRGHPQRKDYPLGGIPVEYKGARIPPPDERRTYS
ncbi:NADH-quinone oxidoreductase subunit C [Nocardia asteroides NBRC 15531]|uniref:NADH-quinone oxidoreductase subunit C n=1 Tax=Nocardia asteroides NBRC 15531 TaxID=1110697 RepID=U5EIJ9_NOCAS|nr:NADH-quinone oxidoreductase subunit C [Nocardia asteroides]TLF67228.1 NADH-quinone oxidoreductase subunit C [Nocardia asteroides NBRC 15531]GAD86216.1 NADH-quinone oxidoreductase subunit C [Nocardia asteroides NBRC 15531]SFM25471.1 NADH dehydrogenase subunit C [Nocardia asteroides]VEG35623.1 NAD(P)H-quinone oxidoreductase subunit J [Nocardia asteroides]